MSKFTNRFVIVFALSAVVLASASFGGLFTSKEKTVLSLVVNQESAQNKILNSAEINNLKSVGEVTFHEAENANSVAVLIPQIHQSPGTEPSDKANDSAVVAQNQIKDIISSVTKETGVNFMVLEGDLYGSEETATKANSVAKENASLEQFSKEAENLKSVMKNNGVSQSIIQKFTNDVDAVVNSVERKLVLKGAPYLLKAENSSIALYGSENKQTREECAQIVRNYVYLEDRKQQLSTNTSGVNGKLSSATSNANLQSLISMISNTAGSGSGIQSDLLSIKSLSKNNGNLQTAVSGFENAYNGLKQCQVEQTTTTTSAYSRNNNPYSSVVSLNQINGLIVEAEKDINDNVLERRNKETAENFAQALKDENRNSGMLVFGAEHKKGLVEELNKQGVSVVVITPKEVLTRADN